MPRVDVLPDEVIPPRHWLLLPVLLLILGQSLLARGWVEWKPDCEDEQTHEHLSAAFDRCHSHFFSDPSLVLTDFSDSSNDHDQNQGNNEPFPCSDHREALSFFQLGNPQHLGDAPVALAVRAALTPSPLDENHGGFKHQIPPFDTGPPGAAQPVILRC